MSIQYAVHARELDLGDGGLHSLPCPSLEHPREPTAHDVLVRFAPNVAVRRVPNGVWMLRCWTEQCSYRTIAEGLGIELPEVRSGVVDLLPYWQRSTTTMRGRLASSSMHRGRSFTPVSRTAAVGRSARVPLLLAIAMTRLGAPSEAPT